MFNSSNRADHVRPLGAIGQNSSTLTAAQCSHISPSSSHFFEVLYIGKVRIPVRKFNDAFLDAALLKFKQSELQRSLSTNYHSLRRPSQDVELTENGFSYPKNTSSTVNMTDYVNTADTSDFKPFAKPQITRNRANSIAIVPNTNKENSDNNGCDIDQNRTMLFHVGRSDLRLVSPDRKQTLLYKQLRDVFNCVQSKDEPNHFGVICRDPSTTNGSQNTYLCYVFKCESDSVVSEIIAAVKQSHGVDSKKTTKNVVMNCEHCPMVWYQRILMDIQGLKDQRMQDLILMRINELPEEEQKIVFNKLNKTASLSIMDDNCAEQVQLMLTILRTHCESKQNRHVHDTAENRHEFLNHYLGGSTIFSKAKKSLTNSFDQLLKRKPSKESFGQYSLPLKSTLAKELRESSLQSSNSSLADASNDGEFKRPHSPTPLPPIICKESCEEDRLDSSPTKALNSPKMMKEIFLKVGSSPRSTLNGDMELDDNDNETASWRQNILKNVITPKKHAQSDQCRGVRDRAQLRELWKKAINQQILLIRMERENANLYARQEEATTKRIKLEYDDICSSAKENTEVWEQIMNRGDRKYDDQMLLQAIKKGIPRSKRGEVWIFLAEQFCARMPPPIDTSKFPKYNVPYDQLLKELTSQQHAILIDLGRTFPNHSYFMSPLGPGQLALFNLLKAYSLLDEEVAYCQGLSFIAGVLLLHMSEGEAFRMLRHLMFRRNLRQQYLPDMAGLQIQLYQLTRLLRDYLPELYEHFEKHEISPILYAAPWILTIFASQFPLGFVVRIFDLIFIEGSGIIFKTILALLTYHKDCLLACDGFEQIMDYLKITVPLIEEPIMDFVVKTVCTTDITRPLLEYSVEYNVLQEELATPRPEIKKLKQMEEINRSLREKNQLLTEQLEIALSNNSRSETVRVKHLSQINKLESEVRSLEVTVATLGNFISTLAYGKTDVEIPNDVLRILSQLNIAERRRSVTKVSLSDAGSDSDSLSRDSSITLGQARSLPPKAGSSYFAKSFDQIRQQQKQGVFSSGGGGGGSGDVAVVVSKQATLPAEKPLTKSLSDTHNLMKFDRIVEESASADRSQSLGRALNAHEMETLKQFQQNYRKQESSSPETPKRTTPAPLKPSKSDFELITPMTRLQTSTPGSGEQSPYPLNCGGVQISYRGTRVLKSLRPTRTRTDLHADVPPKSPTSPTAELNNNNVVTVLVNGNSSDPAGDGECGEGEHVIKDDNNCNRSVDSAFDESVESVESGGSAGNTSILQEKADSPAKVMS